MSETQTLNESDIKAMVATILAGMASGTSSAPVPATAPSLVVEDATCEQRFEVPNPANRQAYLDMMATTAARIGEGRAGARPTVKSLLRFRADHAGAMDAVFSDVSADLLAKLGLFCVQSAAADRAAFLMDPTIGAHFTPEMGQQLSQGCTHGAQVQIIVADGLSSTAIERNIPDLLPSLEQGLKRYGLSVGTNVFVKYGRVRIMDEVTSLLGCEVAVNLIGERPGLVTNESLSCYLTYKGHPGMAESGRTVVSNIYSKGTPPVEAGAYLADIAKKMIDTKSSGMDLKL
ncbi:MAG: ethanolamine ammonia-lyase subunit EutC [Propionibacteriaceae bacterium]|nr:ethanolamine ammonia-lyase subunit EutC [Propionibacteriaceae bacterium]